MKKLSTFELLQRDIYAHQWGVGSTLTLLLWYWQRNAEGRHTLCASEVDRAFEVIHDFLHDIQAEARACGTF